MSLTNLIGAVRSPNFSGRSVRQLALTLALVAGFLFLASYGSTPRVTEAAPPPASLSALFVVGSTTLSAGDAATKTRLENLGLTVSVKDAVSAVTGDANGKGLVVISESCPSTDVSAKFRDVAVPVVVLEPQVFDDMLLTGPTVNVDFGFLTDQLQVQIDNPTHQMAANLTGSVSLAGSPSGYAWGVPGGNAIKVASLSSVPGRSLLFGYEKGVTMVGMTAPARRAGVFLVHATATAVNNNGWALFDAAVRWSANLPSSSLNSSVLFVVGSTTLSAGDAATKTRLENLGLTVSVKDAVSAVTGDANGKGLVVISESCPSTDVSAKFRDVAVPVVVLEPQVFDDMLLTGPTVNVDFGFLTDQLQVQIDNPIHQMAANLTGSVSLAGSPSGYAWGIPGANAIKVASLSSVPGRSLLFGYEKGATMVGMTAPARRAGVFLVHATATSLNSNGWALFDAAIRWCGNWGVNVARSSNGGVASASLNFSLGYLPSGTINGDANGEGWGFGGGWMDGSNSDFPDWVQVDFQGMKTINEIDVFTVQDAISSPAQPTEHMTFTSYGATNYSVQYWKDNSWWAVPHGSVTDNNKVWRRFTFSNIRTNKIRVSVNDSADHAYSRIVEVEAWQSQANQTPSANPGGPYYGTTTSPVVFNGSGSADNDGAIVSYQWNFGDGSTGSGASPSHTYSSAGTYNVTLGVTDDAGGVSSLSTTATIAVGNNPPIASAGGPYVAPQTSAMQFNGSASYDTEGAITNYQWNFGDGTTGTGPTPSHTYVSTGTYTVTLTVTDSSGATAPGTTTATIYPASNKLPVAAINSTYSAVQGTAAQFNASGSFDPDGHIAEYKWDFAGFGTASGPTPSFTFNNTGTHLVSVTVTDNYGAKSWTSINVVVSVSPGQQQAIGDSDVSDWDQFNRRSLDDPSNNRGAPANTATGNNNFQLVAPVLSLSGRGMNLNLNLVYNSLVWNKSGSEMYFDIDHDWPAPGWHLGFGKMVAMGSAGCLLVEPDGSRHPFSGVFSTYTYPANAFRGAVNVPTFKGQTTDGSLIEYRCEQQVGGLKPEGVARYPNGTQVLYTNYSLDLTKPKNYLYPYLIVDANGNRTSIKYIWDLAEPRIERIVDSVGRVISFHYDSQKRLTSITAPGLKDENGVAPTYTFMRLHYRTEPLNLSSAFSGPTHVRNTSPQVIDAIYYPATGTGYWFGADAYSSYGMVKKVTQQRGMTFTPSSPNEQGTVTEGTVTRIQTYDYPATPMNLASAPVFNSISETWDGLSSGTSPVTNFLIQDNSSTNERTVTVTNPDETKTVQISFSLNSLPDSDPNKFKNGLTKEERKLDKNGVVIQKTVFTWEQGANGAPRLQKTETTDERNQTLTTAYDQYGENNAVGRVREFDYTNVVFRSTLNTFVSYQDADLEVGINPSLGGFRIIHPRRINLVASTKIFDGDDSANKLAAYTKMEFDDYPQPLKGYTPDVSSTLDLFEFGESRQPGGISGILQHSTSFNPLPPASGNSPNGGAGANYLTKRGNVTSITRYADTSNAAAPASPIVENIKYDMTGNVIAASKTCCEEASSVFELQAQYAFPSSQTRGAADANSLLRITTTTTYDLNTGLPRFTTNANGRTTETKYFPTSLRPQEIISATGSRVIFEYDDAVMKVVMTTRLSANGALAGKTTKYFNGLGKVTKEEVLGAGETIDIVETVYDQFGRPVKQSRPYRSGQTPIWRETKYDPAGRLAEQWEPPVVSGKNPGEANPKTKYFYNETTRPLGASTEPGQTTRTVDPWNRERWVRLDSAGRLAEVIEPNPAGGIGFQTKYSYNALNKLVRSEQGDSQQGVQVRRFRYDSLSRLTHQKLAETEATLNVSGQLSSTGSPDERWSDVFTYDERSNLISRTDARGVKTTLNYKDASNNPDPLNRLQSISYNTADVPSGLTVLPAATVSYQYRTKTLASNMIDVSQLKKVIAANGSTNVSTEEYDYDSEGRVEKKLFTFGGRPLPMTTTYAYDTLGRIQQVTYPEQYHDGVQNPARKAVNPSYDNASRVDGIKVNNVDYASQITFNASSQVLSMQVGSGANQLTETYGYETLSGLLSTQLVSRGTNQLMSLRYEYRQEYCDGPGSCADLPESRFYTGQLTKMVNLLPAGQEKTQHFNYDSLGRLKQADRGSFAPDEFGGVSFRADWTQSYSYDRFGNRTGVTVTNAPGSNVTADGLEALTYGSQTNRITSAGFAYDPAGNQSQNNSGKTFLYDAAGRLAQVKDQAGIVLATYTYGASNHRLITQTGTETSTDKTYYIWQGNSVITEYVEQTSATMPKWSKNYIYLGARLLATQKPNGSGEIVHYHHPDRLGTRLVTNNLDTTSSTQNNLPFGTALDAELPDASNRRFTSYERSGTTGLDYAVNRQYDSRQGRFTQVDPLGMAAASLADPQTLNMYSYVGNDPVNRVDPDGQFWGALFKFIAGLFTSLRPNVINGSFTYRNNPPISVSFTPNFQHISVAAGGVGFNVRSGGRWLTNVLQSSKDGTPGFVNAQAVIDCASRYFDSKNAQLIYKPNEGIMEFRGDLVHAVDVFFAITLIPQPATVKADLSRSTDWITKSTGAGRWGGVAYGWTDQNRPLNPYLPSDWPGSAFGLYGKFIHELGNALAILNGGFYLNFLGQRIYVDEKLRPTEEQRARYDNDDDPGVVFEDCVFGRHVDISDKPKP